MQILGTGASGLMAQQLALDTLSNNMANINTPGYKSQDVDFAEALSDQMRPAGTTLPNGIALPGALNVGTGVVTAATGTDFQQGTEMPTENPLDLAVDGEGFFQVSLPNGQTAYTRAGNFRLDANGNLTDSQGDNLQIFQLQGALISQQNGVSLTRYPMIKPNQYSLSGYQKVTVGTDGTISGTLSNGTEVKIGRIILANFSNPEGLTNIGNNLFQASVSSGTAQTGLPGTVGVNGTGKLGLIRNHALEQSNVDLGKEMTDMIQIQRAYQFNARMIQDGDQMWGIANSIRR